MEWNFDKRAKKYSGKCDEVKGSIGDLWPPLIDNKTVDIFVPDICTYVSVKIKHFN